MLSINMSDVMNVITSIQSYLIAIGIIIAVAVICMIAVMKVNKPAKKLIRGTALVAMLTGIVVCVNMICSGPMSTMLDLVSGSGTIAKETSDQATVLAQDIAREGIVLLENDSNTLPLATGAKLNVFGWASTNPILGGAGSGALNEAYATTGAASSLKLADLRGVDKNDAKWDELLNSMSLDDMNALISLGGYQTNSVDSIGKVRTNDCDGPASINNNFTGVGSLGFPVGVTIAATFNKDLAHSFGDYIGKMANEMDVSGWYAPAMNIHRTAFAGRNFEYYSEDGILSGYIAAEACKGSWENGVYAYIKHFAMNDQEENRCDMLCTWSNEQAIREIYLRPFEICVKNVDMCAVMSSFNYIGNRWAGGSSTLMKTVLRDEWGFDGFALTDYFGVYGYMSSDQAIRNGTDCMLVNYPTATNNVQFRDTNGAQQAMRDASKNILYTVVNSRAYAPENLSMGMASWKKLMIALDVIFGALMVCLMAIFIKNYNKRKAEMPKEPSAQA
jgi:beta-glucosidase